MIQGDGLRGIELSERYFRLAALPLLRAHFPHLEGRCAAALCAGGLDVGCGSEVYGWDDALSRDHNWGPRFFLFLGEEDYLSRAEALRALLHERLPRTFDGFSIRPTTNQATHFHITTPRRNLLAVLGTRTPPVTDAQWFAVPEAKMSEYAAGSVYHDPLHMLSDVKRAYAAYPRNVLLKRLAGAVFMTHAAGNALRCAARGEYASCRAYLDMAVGSVQRAALLLSGRFPPHMKWRARAFRELPGLPAGWAAHTEALAVRFDPANLANEVRALLAPLGEMLNASGLIDPLPVFAESDFLPFNCYRFSSALEDKVEGELAGRKLAVALDQMAEGFLPHCAEALEAHWQTGRPGLARLRSPLSIS
jgi:hypothetical protein